MNTFERSKVFSKWLAGLADQRARARILARIDSAIFGNFGDCEFIAQGVYEMRIHFGAGYRVYYIRREEKVYLLLAGGVKGTQKRDIRRALDMARDL